MSDMPAEMLDGEILAAVRDPYPMFAAMRRNGIAKVDVQGVTFYVVLRYDDVTQVLRDPETFSSSIMRQVMGPVMGHTILEMGGREHTVHRGLVSHAFRPQAIERYGRTLIEPLVAELMDDIRRTGPRAELGSQLTSHFPLTGLARQSGVPMSAYRQFQQWSLDLIGYKETAPRKGLAASRALKEYLAPVIAMRRERPREDLISELLAAEVDGERLSQDDIFGFLLLLL